MQNFDFYNPTHIVFGQGRIADLNKLVPADAHVLVLTGGESARKAMEKTAKGLLSIQDPATRANAAISLFGTPIEDLSIDQIPAFLSALANVSNRLGDTRGSADRLGDTLRDREGRPVLDAVETLRQGFTE